MLVAEPAQRIGGKAVVLDLYLLQAEDVRAPFRREAGDDLETDADRVDVPGRDPNGSTLINALSGDLDRQLAEPYDGGLTGTAASRERRGPLGSHLMGW